MSRFVSGSQDPPCPLLHCTAPGTHALTHSRIQTISPTHTRAALLCAGRGHRGQPARDVWLPRAHHLSRDWRGRLRRRAGHRLRQPQPDHGEQRVLCGLPRGLRRHPVEEPRQGRHGAWLVLLRCVCVVSLGLGWGSSQGVVAGGRECRQVQHTCYTLPSCPSPTYVLPPSLLCLDYFLWPDPDLLQATEALRITPADLLRFKVMDESIPEPLGAAHTDPMAAFPAIKEAIMRNYHRWGGGQGGAWGLGLPVGERGCWEGVAVAVARPSRGCNATQAPTALCSTRLCCPSPCLHMC